MDNQPTTSTQAVILPAVESAPVLPVKEFDIVIDFQERPTDRLIFTRGPAVCEVESTSFPSHYFNLCTWISVPFNDMDDESKPSASIVPLHWTRVTPPVKDLWLRWIGNDEKMAENKKILAGLVRVFTLLSLERSYVAVVFQGFKTHIPAVSLT